MLHQPTPQPLLSSTLITASPEQRSLVTRIQHNPNHTYLWTALLKEEGGVTSALQLVNELCGKASGSFEGINDVFLEACAEGALALAERLRQQGANIYYERNSRNAVLEAAKSGHFSVLRWLRQHWIGKHRIFEQHLLQGLSTKKGYTTKNLRLQVQFPEQLDLSNYHLQDSNQLRTLLLAMEQQPWVQQIDLSHNHQCAKATGQALGQLLQNQPLTMLKLSYNRLGGSNRFQHAGITLIADGLASNTTLQELYLAHNWVSDDDVVYLAEKLKDHPALVHLDLSRNPSLSDRSAEALLELLDSKIRLETINLSNNHRISDKLQQKLDERLAERRDHRQLPLQTNHTTLSVVSVSPQYTYQTLNEFPQHVAKKLSFIWEAVNLLDTHYFAPASEHHEAASEKLKLALAILMLPKAGHTVHGITGLAESLWEHIEHLVEKLHLVEFLSEVPLLHALMQKIDHYWKYVGKASEIEQIERFKNSFFRTQDCHKTCHYWVAHLTTVYTEQLQQVHTSDRHHVIDYIATLAELFIKLGHYRPRQPDTADDFVSWVFFASHYLADPKVMPKIRYGKDNCPIALQELFALPGLYCQGTLKSDISQSKKQIYFDLIIIDQNDGTQIETQSQIMGYRQALAREAVVIEQASQQVQNHTETSSDHSLIVEAASSEHMQVAVEVTVEAQPYLMAISTIDLPATPLQERITKKELHARVQRLEQKAEILESEKSATVPEPSKTNQPRVEQPQQDGRQVPAANPQANHSSPPVQSTASNTLEQRVSLLETDNKTLKTENTNLKNNISSLNDTITTLSRELQASKEEVSNLKGELEAQNKKHDKNEEEISNLKAIVSTLLREHTAHNNQSPNQTVPPIQIESTQTGENNLPPQTSQIDTEENVSATSALTKQRIDSVWNTTSLGGFCQPSKQNVMIKNTFPSDDEEDINQYTTFNGLTSKNSMQ